MVNFMKIDMIKSIQYDYKQLTHSKISKYEVQETILPVINYINNNKYNKFLLSGPQGSGKTTLSKIIELAFERYLNKKILSLSLDDFYYEKKERMKLVKSIHPLLATRGVPGTHDINYLKKIINKFEKQKYPLQLPIFDKLSDTRKKTKKNIKDKCEIMILEGWCVGCPPLSNKYLYMDINLLEKKFDTGKIWRTYYNNNLRNDYSKIFNHFNSIIYLKPPSFSEIFKWRLKQERYLKKINININSLGMSKKEIANFIQHYEKITKWMTKKMPKKAKLILYINKEQKIMRLKKN